MLYVHGLGRTPREKKRDRKLIQKGNRAKHYEQIMEIQMSQTGAIFRTFQGSEGYFKV